MKDESKNKKYLTVIEPANTSLKKELRELLEYKDLLWFLVIRDVKVIYKQTILGFAWAIIQPLAAMIIFTIFFGKLAGIEDQIKDGIPYPVFAYVALVPWMYFQAALTGSANSLIGNTNLLSKVYFPRIIIPITPILAKLVDFSISLLVLFILFYAYGLIPFFNRIMYLPPLIVLMALTALGAGLWLSALSIQFRDVRFLLPFLIQLLMFASPIIWPVSFVPEEYQLIYAINPLVGIIEGFREAIIGQYEMPWDLIKVGTASSIILFLSGLFYFKRKENYFADVL